MIQAAIDEIEAELSIELPEFYKAGLRQVDAAFGNPPFPFDSEEFLTGADEVIELNESVGTSAPADWDNVADPADYFFIGHDGCGNYFAIDPDDDASPVYYLIHDPLDLIETAPTLFEFIEMLVNPRPSPFGDP